jgi:DNA-binding MarR family transcriptional regulator
MAWVRMLDALAHADSPLSVSSLGDAIGVDQPRASRLVQQAAEHGLVRREADPEDARRTRIALTEDGLRMARRMTDAQRDSVETALGSFTKEERGELARLLTKLAENWRS